MIILDTNVLSEPLRARPNETVARWLDAQHPSTLFITAFTVAELRVGIASLPPGKRRNLLRERIEDAVIPVFEGRILSFDPAAAHSWAEIQIKSRAVGRPVPVMDSLIAAVAHSRKYILATRSTKDFTGIEIDIINPWQG